jgi:hypothetical protein
MFAEHEITKILHMLDELYTELGIAKIDKELDHEKNRITGGEEVEHVIEEEKRTNVLNKVFDRHATQKHAMVV